MDLLFEFFARFYDWGQYVPMASDSSVTNNPIGVTNNPIG